MLWALTVWGLSARANTLIVSSTADDSGSGTLRNQIAAAAPGDTINFSVTGTIMLTNGVIPITNNLTIAGPGAGSLTVSGPAIGLPHSFSIFGISSGIVGISGLTLSNFNFFSNNGKGGGAIYLTGGTVALMNSAFFNNISANGSGGAIYMSGGSLAITSCIFSNNIATATNAASGGAIEVANGSLAVTNSTFVGNRATGNGGAMNIDGGSLALVGCTISNNSSGNAGGINGGGTVMIANSTLFNNTAQTNSVAVGVGGGIVNGGSMTIINSTISGNQSASGTNSAFGGGGIQNLGTLTVANSTITLNSGANGGGIYNFQGRTLSLSNSIVAANSVVAGAGADIYGTVTSGAYNLVGVNPNLGALADNGGPTLTHALLAGSPAIGAGDPNFDATRTPYDQRGPGFPRVSSGGLCIGAFQLEPNQTGSNFIVNSLTDHDYGSCGPSNGSLREAIKYSPAGANITFGVAGTIPLTRGEIVIGNSVTITGPASAPGITISGNSASRIFTVTEATNAALNVNFSTLTLTGGNGVGSTNNGSGGAIYIDVGSAAIVTVSNCTIFGNSATNAGGAIYNVGALRLTSCTLSGNSATNNGGAIFNNQGALKLTSCTVANNKASNGGGIYVFNPSLSLSNTIVAANTAATNSDLSVLSTSLRMGDYDLVQNPGGATLPGSHNITGQPALLGPLAYYGGPTPTMALLPGSPAIDAGNTTLTTDQRGVARPQGPAADIGAFELGLIFPPTLSIQAIPPSQVQINWYTVTNAWYQLQYSSALNPGQWSPLGGWIEGGGQMISTNDSVLIGQQGFYRVGVTNSP
jgi:CSLREA domain-containing protein